jgi:lipopolysaccharide/colanic/teichoic acid biosynthesis glycosyltransferase
MSLAVVDCTETELSEQPVFYVATPILREKTLYKAVKRAFDIVLSFLSLVVLLIPMLIIALIIVIDSPGAAIFKQERLGLNGKPFTIYKFRSMHTDAEKDGPKWAALEDDRCTRFGAFLRKTRLDELPQLWNILKGDMSFVGPRPERVCFYEKFEKYIVGFSNRMAVVPGLTGHAQVNGGYELKPEEKIIYDMEYIENRSIKMDLVCILKTFEVVFSGNGAR